MIDVHCHLEQKNYDADLDSIVEQLKEKLHAVISVATNPRDLAKGLEIKKKYEGFVFLAMGIHPEYIEKVSAEERAEAFEFIKKHAHEIVSVSESGLDFFWVKSPEFRELQKQYFRDDISFARSLDKPVSVHSRDAHEETAEILAEEGYERVHWHLFKYRSIVPYVLKHGWMVSIGPLILNSKTVHKIVKDIPMEQIMLETDSPWWGGEARGTPLNIVPVAEKIAEVKKLSFDEVWKTCGRNAIDFFDLK